MNNEVLLWLVGELGLSVDADSVGKHKRVRFVYDGMWVRFDLEGNMPINAWLRELVVKWLYGMKTWLCLKSTGMWYVSVQGAYYSEHETYEQAILAAVQWVYDNREEK